jgi:hypothetical protein
MTIISTLPFPNLANGAEADATQVDANFAAIVSNVNSNAQAGSVTGSSYIGATACNSVDQTCAAGTDTFLSVDASIYNPQTIWANSGGHGVWTVPTGVTKGRIFANIEHSGVASGYSIGVSLGAGGADFASTYQSGFISQGTQAQSVFFVSNVFLVTPGDHIEFCILRGPGGNTMTIARASIFEIQFIA